MSRKYLPLLLCLFLLAPLATRATVYYVNSAQTTNNGNGQSWGAAKKDLQAAIDAAANNDEIWVKAGTYKPTRDANGVTVYSGQITFVLTTKDLKLYGGFAGTETLLSQRNATTNVTILSGDINANVNGTITDAFHVMLCLDRTSACVIDGFSINSGTANAGYTYRINTPLADVSGSMGGGIYNDNSSPTISNCAFGSNTATTGGAIYNNTNSTPVISSCTFTNNTGSVGAAIYNDATTGTISNCTFTSNTATVNGGAVYNFRGTATISGCAFNTNTAWSDGGALYNQQNTLVTITSCSFIGNVANNSGGGMYNNANTLTVSSCVFSANTANVNTAGCGGGMCNSSSNPTVENCVFSANVARLYGGGVYAYNGGPVLRSCTFSGNSAGTAGGGVNMNNGSVTNCVLSGNTGGPANQQNIFRDAAAAGGLTVSYSMIGDYNAAAANFSAGAVILSGDPLFTNALVPTGYDGIFGTADDGLRLSCVSPARDRGTGSTPITDFVGNARVSCIDMGAYENTGAGCPNIQYVDGSRTSSGNGYSWAYARKDLQEAINTVTAGGEVWVEAGTYKPTQDANGSTTPTDNRDKTFYIKSADIGLYGGFLGTETSRSQRNATTNVTILSGDLDGTGNNDAYHVLLTINRSSACLIDGFTIRDGNGNGTGPFNIATPTATAYRSDAGGMLNLNSSLQLHNCIIRNNSATTFGGGMYNIGGASQLFNCTFTNNAAGERGGGMTNNSSSPQVVNCAFSSNSAPIKGGGMYNFSGSSVYVRNCVFSANTTTQNGGGMHNEGNNPTVVSSVFSANTAGGIGGGMYNDGSGPAVSSCTFSANRASSIAGGIFYNSTSGGGIINSILSGNLVGLNNKQNIYKDAGTSLFVTYSLVGGYSAGATNNYTASNVLADDPVFVNATAPAGADGVFYTADDGLRLDCPSPARDMGTGTTPATDFTGNARVGIMDMGAYENTGCVNYIQYVDGSRTTSGNGYGWGGAKRSIQEAIESVMPYGDVWVKAGTYLPTQDPNGNATPSDPRDKTFYLTDKDIRLYGGFAGTETNFTQRNPTTNVTILSGDLDGNGGTNDAYHVLLTIGRTSACEVDGFTISGGRADGSSSFTVTAPSATIGQSFGGGVFNSNSSPTISRCVLVTNTASIVGGGMINSASSNPALTGCTFLANASSYGGGMYCSQSSPTVKSCVFSNNTASSNGGGMMAENSSNSTILNCIFSANAAGNGGALHVDYSSPIISSSTFSRNTASGIGAGMWFGRNTGGSVINCISYGNAGGPVEWQDCFGNGTTGLTVSVSLIGSYNSSNAYYNSGPGILTGDPLFVNALSPAGADGKFGTSDDGLALRSCSPAVNSGSISNPAVTKDLLNNNRVGAYDLGAYEYQSTATVPVLAGATTVSNQVQYTGESVAFGDCNTTIATLRSTGSQPVQGIVSARVYVQNATPIVGQTPYVRRYYDITPSSNPSTATGRLTLYFTQADFDAYNAVRRARPPLPLDANDVAGYKANVQVTQEHGNSPTGAPGSYSGWTGVGPAKVLFTNPSVSWNVDAARWEVSFPVTGFSGFFLHSGFGLTPLPVKLLAFGAKKVGASLNRIEWETAEEEPSTLFTVERSEDAKTFEPIGVVAGRGQQEKYQLEDAAPLKGNNYYRLSITESGNEVRYSNTALVKDANENPLGVVSIIPNPIIDKMLIRCNDKSYWGEAAVIVGTDGRIITRFILDAEVHLDVAHWIAGIYLLRLPDGTGIRIVKD